MDQYYRHFRNKKIYRFVTFATLEATGEEAVVYQAMYANRQTWIRTKTNFFEKVLFDGQMVPRFQPVSKEEADGMRIVLADMADASRDGGRAYIDFSREDLRRWRKLRECGEDATVKEAAKKARIDASTFGRSCRKVDAHVVSQVKDIMKRRGY